MLKVLLPIALIALIISSHPGSMDYGILMMGYTDTKFLPFLDNGLLKLQLGEKLWIRAVGGDVEFILRSPKGSEEAYKLSAGESKLLKKFSDEHDVGNWTLEIVNRGSMHLLVKNPENEPLTIRYRFGRSDLVAELDGSPNAVFVGVEGLERYLLVAGGNNKLNLSTLLERTLADHLTGELIVDILMEDYIIYSGFLEGSTYQVEIEPLTSRITGKIVNETFHVNIPSLHEVGTGGIIPLRPGKAVLRIWLNETNSFSKPAYILDKRFTQFVGTKADRIAPVTLSNVLNHPLRILKASDEYIKAVELTLPIALIRVQDLHGSPLTNISILADNPLSIVNDAAYVLLRKIESIPALPRNPVRTLIKVYVNGFEAKSLTMDLMDGMIYNVTLNLNRLTVEINPQDGELPKDLNLMINGTSFKHENGLCSYLLPPGEYLIEAKASGLGGSVRINLSGDSTVKLRLRKITSLEDALKISAALELVCVFFLACMNYKRHKRNP